MENELNCTPVVFIVDDDVSVRESLAALIHFAGFNVELFTSAQDFLKRPRPLGPNCLVLDIGLPDLSGLDLQKLLASERTDMPIIFITGHHDVPTTVGAMKAGAADFFTKPCDDEVLLQAIREAIRRSSAALSAGAELRTLQQRYATLSQRERQVMALAVSGLLNKQIGGELGISEITVKTHRGQVMRKMSARTFGALINMAWALHPDRAPGAALRRAAA
jgi:FixJ family two-component response regulator